MDWKTYSLRRKIDIDGMLSRNKLSNYGGLCEFLTKKGVDPPPEDVTLGWKWWTDGSAAGETGMPKKAKPVTPETTSSASEKVEEKPAWKRKKKVPKKKAPSKNG